MNIKQAKEQIRQAVEAYRTKDEYGDLLIPPERQRPIFLMGAPGIGKTAIMEQIAQEMGIGLVSYSMTHHTRQSALGLPFIVHKNYGGREYAVSEYTMSEIIAAVWDRIEEDGVQEGILFLDEINCVSETLAPSMLQFLQYKTFGRHAVPEGWTVVTAGNPPEYNDSVREFDTVTWDRLKRIDVEPDFESWKEYAVAIGVHPAILSYLEIRKQDFYSMETTVDGKRFVTARGWVDLSEMMKIYEKRNYAVNGQLIRQYLQNEAIARSFAMYYDLFRKYQSDYQVKDILAGRAPEKIKARAKAAKFDERLSLLSMLLDAMNESFNRVADAEEVMLRLMNNIRPLREQLLHVDTRPAAKLLDDCAGKLEKAAEAGRRANSMTAGDVRADKRTAAVLREMAAAIRKEKAAGAAAFALVKQRFDAENAALKADVRRTGEAMEHMFAFCEEVFPDGRELLLLITELTANPTAARFIGKYGSDAYFRNNKSLMFGERRQEILRQIDELDLEG